MASFTVFPLDSMDFKDCLLTMVKRGGAGRPPPLCTGYFPASCAASAALRSLRSK